MGDGAGELVSGELGFRRAAPAAVEMVVPTALEEGVENEARKAVVMTERPVVCTRRSGEFDADETAVLSEQSGAWIVVGGG